MARSYPIMVRETPSEYLPEMGYTKIGATEYIKYINRETGERFHIYAADRRDHKGWFEMRIHRDIETHSSESVISHHTWGEVARLGKKSLNHMPTALRKQMKALRQTEALRDKARARDKKIQEFTTTKAEHFVPEPPQIHKVDATKQLNALLVLVTIIALLIMLTT